MIPTCGDLDKFVDQLCDLTRDMDPMELAREATSLLELVDAVPRRFLMAMRAAAVADLHYLQGQHLRQIARPELDRSFQSISFWLRDYGPTHYVSLIKEADGTIRAALFTVEGEHTKHKIKQFRAAGRRIVPALENVADPDSPTGVRPGTDLDRLWHRCGG